MQKYDHKQIEEKWRAIWQENNIYKIDKTATGEKGDFYLLDMFPYPSGDGLHMGHTEGHTANDIYYRYKRMAGYNVLYPQGFDSFGLPAENYAIKTGTHPHETTKTNMSNFINQWQMLGFGYDYENMLATSSPDYYKWTQWLFGKFFENNFAYKKTDTVNWCESCNTILANEQIEDGACERCDTEIIQKEIPGWFFRITDFADGLLDGLDKINWPEATKKKQRNWIGKSEGSEITFKIKDREENITVFTTRADTLFGATYVVLAPEHKLVETLIDSATNKQEVEQYLEATKKKTELERLENKEKTGTALGGLSAINPANNEEIPIYISDYVLAGYGTGAVMAVPAHDERDFEFAIKFDLPIKQVVYVRNGEPINGAYKKNSAYVFLRNQKNQYFLQSFDINGKKAYKLPGGGIENSENPEEALHREILEETGYINTKIISKIVELEHNFYNELKKKNIQNYAHYFFGELINNIQREIVHEQYEVDTKCSFEWVPSHKVRELLNSSFSGIEARVWDIYISENKALIEKGILVNSGDFDGMTSDEAKVAITNHVGGELKSTYRLRDWSISRQRYWGTPIPIVYSPDGEPHFVGEENLPWILPTDVDFVPTGVSPLSKSVELQDRVTRLFGEGWTAEYDTMDTFVDSAWYYLRYPDHTNDKEFCSKEMLKKWLPVDAYLGGAEHAYMHLLYARYFTKALNKIGIIEFDEPFMSLRHQGMVNDKDGKKMSKSKGNIVNPNDMVEKFGADAVRTYMMFAAPLEDDVIWNEDNIVGVSRFLDKVWGLQDKITDQNLDNIEKELHKLIKSVGDQINQMKYNTAVSDMMKFVNFVYKEKEITQDQLLRFVTLLAPYAPFMCDEIASTLGSDPLVTTTWPEYDESLLGDDEVTIGVQINGKRRGDITVASGATQESVIESASSVDSIKKWLDEGKIRKVIYVPGKILNIVVG